MAVYLVLSGGDLLDRFRDDDDCRVFLSTDAGGVGLNLQRAALIVNLDLPWNPAVLEQRIGRVYRLGQRRNVQVVNLIAEGTIEHNMVQKLKFKSSLAESVLDAGEDSVFMSDSKFKDFMETLEKVSDMEGGEAAPSDDTFVIGEDLEKAPAADTESPKKEPQFEGPMSVIDDWWEEESEETTRQSPNNTTAENVSKAGSTGSKNKAEKSNISSGNTGQQRQGAQNLIAQGSDFLGRLTQTLSDQNATQELVNELVRSDKKTGETYLKIPVESADVVRNAMQLFGALFGKK